MRVTRTPTSALSASSHNDPLLSARPHRGQESPFFTQHCKEVHGIDCVSGGDIHRQSSNFEPVGTRTAIASLPRFLDQFHVNGAGAVQSPADWLRCWMRQADIDVGARDGLTTAEVADVVQLRRESRRMEMENEILRRAAAYFRSAVVSTTWDHRPRPPLRCRLVCGSWTG